MSTRGSVAIKQDFGEWRGVYNHYDSYPEGLGKELWAYLKVNNIDLKKFAEELLKYDDWRNYLNGGLCPYCGKTNLGQPHTLTGKIIDFESKEYSEGPQDYFPDPECKDHSHHPLEGAGIYSKNAKFDALFIEWVYVVDPILQRIEIYSGVRAKGKHKEASYDGARSWMAENYQYVLVKVVDLNSPEPDWKAIDEYEDKFSELFYEAYKIKVERNQK